MQMRHRFASIGAVIDDQAEASSEAEFAGHGAGGEEEVAEDGLLVGSGLADSRYHRFRDDQEVDGRGGSDVVYNDAVIVLVLDVRRDFAGDDSFE